LRNESTNNITATYTQSSYTRDLHIRKADRTRVWHLRANDCKHPERLPK